MTLKKFRDSLGIFWKGEEAQGLIFYVLFAESAYVPSEFPLDIWPRGSAVEDYQLVGEGWKVDMWEVLVPDWPEDSFWDDLLRTTFRELLKTGGLVAWIGFNEYFSDPPELFLPERMSGGVLAAATSQGFYSSVLELNQPISALSDDEMLVLRSHAAPVFDSL